MKYVKILGLAAMAVAALMAFAGPASATTITSNAATDPTTPTITASSIGTTTLTSNAFVTVQCAASHVHGKVEQHGAGVTAKGNLSKLEFTSCNYPVTVLAKGSLEVHGTSKTGNGTLTSSGARVLVHTSVGECEFATSNTDIGELTGSNITKGHAVLDIESAAIPVVGGSFFCPSSAVWEGQYTVTSPSSLEVH